MMFNEAIPCHFKKMQRAGWSKTPAPPCSLPRQLPKSDHFRGSLSRPFFTHREMSNALPDEKLPAIMLDGARTESSTGASPSKQRPPLTAISSSSITSQHTYIPPSSASSLQPTSISSPLSPPPPSFHDDETTQEIEQALARKQSRGWRRISPRAVVSPFVRKRDDGGGGEAVSLRHSEETPDRNGSIKHRRPTVSRDITFGSVKFEPVARKGTLVEGTDERALYKYAYVYENQRGYAAASGLIVC